jgi:phytoene dehydrogenase-like protein
VPEFDRKPPVGKRKLPDDCDVVVIGAGIGGLTAAAALGKAGLRVCVLERDKRPGGYLAGFGRSGFRFDTSIHWLNQCGPGGLVRRVFDSFGSGAPETPPLLRIRRYKSASFDYLLTDNPDDLRDEFIRDFPEDEKGIRKFFEVARAIGEKIDKVGRNCRTPETMGLFEKARILGPDAISGLGILRHSRSTEKHLSKYFKSAALRNVFCSEENMLSCLVPIGWAYMGDYQQPPEGGSQAFPAWLCKRIAEFGGTIAYRSGVSKIGLDNNGLACTVETEGGETVACEHIVAACDLHTLYQRLLPEGLIPARSLERIEQADVYDSSVTLSIGLDVSPAALGFGDELLAITRDGIAREEHVGADPEKVALSVLAPSLRDPTLAPAGKGTLTIYAAARIEHGDFWKTGPNRERGEAYRKYKKDYADVLIAHVERALGINLREHIEVCEVATPVTHERYTGNRGGSIMGARATGKNIRRRVAHYRTPVKNIVLGGHWAEYGGGVPLAVRAGYNGALLVLQDRVPEAFDRMKHLLDRPK